jgi:hypothetical protein
MEQVADCGAEQNVASQEQARWFAWIEVWRYRFRNVPWWVVSAAFHVLIIALCSLITMSIKPVLLEDVVVVTPLQKPITIENNRTHADLSDIFSKKEVPATDPLSSKHSDIVVPPDVLSHVDLSDHFETINPELPDAHSALGNMDSHYFEATHGNPDPAGGGGTGGTDLESLIGFGGAPSRGSGGGFGGGSGTGVGVDSGASRGCFGFRTGGGRQKLLERHGGSAATEAAVHAALRWLSRHQSQDGHWDIKKLQGGDTPGGGFANDECIAPLVVLAFLGAGHTPVAGEFKDTVRYAIDWIIARQNPNGSLKPSGFNIGAMGNLTYNYGESLAALALSEAYGMTHDTRIRDAAQRSINYIVSAQEIDGGWSHSGCKSTSVVGWMVMALKSAKIAKLNVPQTTFQRALAYLERVSDKDKDGYFGLAGYAGRGQYCYNKGHTMTAVAMVCMQFMGRGSDTPKQAEIIMETLPQWKPGNDFVGPPQNFYHWYYGTLAMFQHGGEDWKKWNAALQKTLLPNQHHALALPKPSEPAADADDDSVMIHIRSKTSDAETRTEIEINNEIKNNPDLEGSWDPCTTWDPSGGRVYSTAMGALCLEVYYRYLQLSPDR